ncbi:MAG: IS1595 family transposase [Chloroflexota bacterium]|nr:IS1595 family transposase [Chloroflexota bacterium]
MPNRLRIIIALFIGVSQPLTLVNLPPWGDGWFPGGQPVLIACILTDDLRFLVIFHSHRRLFWPPARRVRRLKIRRKRPPRPHLPSKPAEEEEPEQPPQGWPKSPHELFDRKACATLFEKVRWTQGVFCPRCGSRAIQRMYRRTQAGLQYYRCLTCQAGNQVSTFHAATGTPFEHSHLSPTQWMMALLSFASGDSALEMADQMGVSSRIGERWLRLFQVIIYRQRPTSPLKGKVEADEIYVISGHKGRPNGQPPPRSPRHRGLKRRGRGTWKTDKPPIVILVRRGGPIRLRMCTDLKEENLRPWLRSQVRRGSHVHTDDYSIYQFLAQAGYRHHSVNHSEGEYARGSVHCNTAEGIWSLLRPYLRTFRGVSKVYLPLYIAAFEFQFNLRHLTTWQQAGVLLQRLFQADGAENRKVVRENTTIEYCQLPM